MIKIFEWFHNNHLISNAGKLNLTHFQPMFHFYTPWKHHKTYGFLNFFRGYRSGTLVENGLTAGSLSQIRETQIENEIIYIVNNWVLSIDVRLDFDYHVSLICKKASKKLHALF